MILVTHKSDLDGQQVNLRGSFVEIWTYTAKQLQCDLYYKIILIIIWQSSGVTPVQ
jgi:hypothetical protein